VSRHQPTRPADRHAFDAIIDARSPAEYAEDHIPGAINCPVLDDEERAIVGTLYHQQGAFEARRVGGAMVAANLARHLRERFADQPQSWRPLVYCWRGGMRSGSMVQWMRLVGWDAQQLAGGYKAFRRHMIATIEALVPRLDLRVLVGATGSAKTRVLQQPSQKNFETQIAIVLERLDLARPLYVEGESARIGRLSVPVPLVERLRAAPCIEIEAPAPERLAYLLRDYAYLGDDPEALAQRLAALTELHGKETVQRWQGWARTHDLAPLFGELMERHYDPHYGRSQARNFTQWEQRQRVAAPDLSTAGMDRLARAVLDLESNRPAALTLQAQAAPD
jgi:tRNA 2-selenouridine synthase